MASGLILGLFGSWRGAEGAGPWRGQIVDAETGQALDGVVILAVWSRLEASLGGWAADQYHASQEVVTGPDGRFEIKSRWAYAIPLVIKVNGPEFVLFKSGYGQYRLREPVRQFDTGEPTIVEMPKL